MEEQEIKQIRKVLLSLVENMTCSTALINYLKTKNCLNDEECQQLSCMEKTNIERSTMLIGIMEKKTRGFQLLYCALNYTKQSGAVKVLQEAGRAVSVFTKISLDDNYDSKPNDRKFVKAKQDYIIISEGNQLQHEMDNIEFARLCSQCIIYDDTSSESLETIDQQENHASSRKTNKKKSGGSPKGGHAFYKTCGTKCIALSLAIVFALVTILLVFIVTMSIKSTTAGVAKKISTSTEAVTIVVNSYHDYEAFLADSINAPTYKVYFNLTQFGNWPANINIAISEKIAELYVFGYMAQNTLINIITQATNIRAIHLNNRKDKLCRFSNGNDHLRTISHLAAIASLNYITLEGFSTACSQMLHAISHHFMFPNVKQLSIKDSELNNDSFSAVHNIIRDSRFSLRKLEFRNTTLDMKYFSWEIIGLLPVLEVLIFEVLMKSSARQSLKNTYLFKQTPKLTELYFGSQPLFLREIDSLHGYNELQYLQTRIKLGKPANFSVAFLQRFSKLKDGDIFLDFSSCGNDRTAAGEVQDKHYFTDLDKLPESVRKKLLLYTHCTFYK